MPIGLLLVRSYKMTYQLLKDPIDGKENAVLLNGSTTVPFAPANTDYQAYIAWVAQGNTPQAAE